MTHQEADLRSQLATRFWNLAGKHRRDIRPFQSIGHELQAEMYALADEALRLMEWIRHDSGGYETWQRTLPPADWRP